MKRLLLATAAVVVAIGAIGLGYWLGLTREDAPAADADAASSGRKVLYWYDPMVPGQHFDKPGKSPYMDMQLVPKYANEVATGGVAISPGVQQNLGIRTVEIERGRLASFIEVPGTIGWDLREERIVSARVDAIVERLHVRAPFEPVRAGQPLASLIAPSWNTAVAEARALDGARSAAARELRTAAQGRLRALGLPAGSRMQGGRIVLNAPVDGVVREIGVREGQSAQAGALLFRINGTRSVWLEAAIPQAGGSGIAAGTPVTAVVDALPGVTFRGRVEALLPEVDPASRTQRARIVLANPDGQLAAGMFAQITLRPEAGEEHVLVPTDALIGTGAQARVIVLGPDNTFRAVRVRPGRSGGGKTEILEGLRGSERVVASGQFLIDSEASLSGALERLSTTTPSAGASEEEAMPNDVMPGMPMPASHPQSATAAARSAATSPERRAFPASTKPKQRKVLYWYDPMVPDKHFDRPGKSPYMDMQLVPKYADEAEAGEAKPERRP